MRRINRISGQIVAFLILSILCACSLPVVDPVKLKAIRVEAEKLMSAYPIKALQNGADIPKARWPGHIASLDPDSVTIHPWGVSILMRPDLDGGWGYDLPRNTQDLPLPAICYSQVSEGIFWHDPC